MRIHRLPSLVRLLTAATVLLILPLRGFLQPRLYAADVGITGTINNVPGYPPGTKLEYTVGATKTAPKTANFWIYLKNNNSFDIKVVVCSMLSLKSPPQPLRDVTWYYVDKNMANEWVCTPAGFTSKMAPNFHHSCVNVTIPAHGIANPFDTKDVFAVDFPTSDLGSVYFDVLKDCPLKNCAQVIGPDGFLVPHSPLGHADYVNLWANSGGMGSSPLGPGGFTSWPSGNWITMGYMANYPARLVGTVSNAPVGSVIQFSFNGRPGGTYDVPPCPNCPPGTGAVVRIEERFVIPPEPEFEDDIHIQIPPETLRNIPEGARMRFRGDVFAEPGAPFYQPGEFMYSIDALFVNDTRPPIIVTQAVWQVSSGLRAMVAATDESTMAAGASFVWSDPSGIETEVGMNFATPAGVGNVMFSQEDFTDLPRGVPIVYHFNVYDDLGNVASSPRQIIDLGPTLADRCNFADAMLPSGSGFPGIGNVARVANDGTGGNCVVHLTDANQPSAFGALYIPAPAWGLNLNNLHLHWRSLIGGDNGTVCTATQFGRPGADGYSLSWAPDLPIPPSYGNPGEEGAGTGLSVTVDTFDNGGGEAPGLEIKWRGTRVAFDPISPDPGLAKDFLRKNVFVDADLAVDSSGHVTFTYDGRILAATLPGWTGIAGGNLMFGARTGGACDNHWIDDFVIGPIILEPPRNQRLACGGTATFTVVASGTEPLAYQWQHNGVDVPGATLWTLSIPLVKPADEGVYSVRVSNRAGSATGAGAILSVFSGAPLRLAVSLNNGNVVIRWPITCIDYDLQETPSLGAAINWAPAAASVDSQNGEYVATTPLQRTANRFFRLAQRPSGGIPSQPPEIPIFEYTEFDPTPIGATDIKDVPWEEIPGSLTDQLAIQIRLGAEQNAVVRGLLGDRYAYLSIATQELEKGTTRDPALPLLTIVTFFSHSFNKTVLAYMTGTEVVDVSTSTTLQPAEGVEEVATAVALARQDPRLADRVQGLRAGGLLVVPTPGQPGYGDRVIHVVFARPGEAGPAYSARVDLTRQQVLSVSTP